MKILKIGGSSLYDLDKLKNVLKEELKNDKVILVVSAIGRYNMPYATDTLKEFGNNLTKKDLDFLLSLGETLSSYIVGNYLLKYFNLKIIQNYDLGIITNSNFGNADILKIKLKKLKKYLKKYDLLIVPGFIGLNKNKETTTLGRDGSFTSAIYLADYFKLKEVTIISNIAGLYDNNLNFLPTVSYDSLILKNPKIIQLKGLIYAKSKNLIVNFTSLDEYNIKVSKVK